MVLAVELFHQDRLAGVQLTVERDLVDDLLIGVDDAVAWDRGDAMGHDLRRPHCVLLLKWQDISGDSLARAVEQAIREMGLDGLWSPRDGMVVLLLEPSGDRDGQPRWPRLHGSVAAALGSTRGAIGVGAPADSPSALPRSFRQAGQSLAIRSRSRAPFGVTTFEELGVYRILARAESRADVEQFVEEWLGTLIAYDRLHGSDMVDTLAEYCESGGNYDRTAQALGIHRSTLRYRLRRIRDISGRDLTGVDARFNLHVATRAWRVLGISG
jgi:sugar diacid utilization regulator